MLNYGTLLNVVYFLIILGGQICNSLDKIFLIVVLEILNNANYSYKSKG